MTSTKFFLLVVAAASVAAQDDLAGDVPQDIDEPITDPPLESSGCRYFCIFDGDVYCCDDGTQELPADHNSNLGTCPKMDGHYCKDDGIFYNLKSERTKMTIIQLFSGSGKEASPCASDGYCQEDEKCCPTPCGRKHLCLKAMACRYYCLWNNQSYCCDDGSLEMPENHEDNAGECPPMETEICRPWKPSLNPKEEQSPYTSCASDGYCAKDEKCCPSRCAWRHACLAAVPSMESAEVQSEEDEAEVVQEPLDEDYIMAQ